MINDTCEHSDESLIWTVLRSVEMLRITELHPERFIGVEEFRRRAQGDKESAEELLKKRGKLEHAPVNAIVEPNHVIG
jgi:hypothetical protein